ncbi:hypothetical protein Q8G50_30820, partial [Klebsiella pneumoniae]
SQGQPVRLYRSRGGVDWEVDYVQACANHTEVDVADEQLVGVKHDGTFVDLYANDYTDHGTLVRETLLMRGKFPASSGAPVIGSVVEHDLSVR